MSKLPENALFVRKADWVSEESQRIYALIESAMNKGPEEFGITTIDHTLQPHVQHDSNGDHDFYNRLYNAILYSIQDPTSENIRYSIACGYLDRFEFGGFAPSFVVSPMMNKNALHDVEPVFNVWCQDDKHCPESTLAFRVAVGLNGELSFMPVQMSWLKESAVEAVTEVARDAKKPKTSANKAKRKGKAKVLLSDAV